MKISRVLRESNICMGKWPISIRFFITATWHLWQVTLVQCILTNFIDFRMCSAWLRTADCSQVSCSPFNFFILRVWILNTIPPSLPKSTSVLGIQIWGFWEKVCYNKSKKKNNVKVKFCSLMIFLWRSMLYEAAQIISQRFCFLHFLYWKSSYLANTAVAFFIHTRKLSSAHGSVCWSANTQSFGTLHMELQFLGSHIVHH